MKCAKNVNKPESLRRAKKPNYLSRPCAVISPKPNYLSRLCAVIGLKPNYLSGPRAVFFQKPEIP